MAYDYEVQYEVQRMSMSTDYKLSRSAQSGERYIVYTYHTSNAYQI